MKTMTYPFSHMPKGRFNTAAVSKVATYLKGIVPQFDKGSDYNTIWNYMGQKYRHSIVQPRGPFMKNFIDHAWAMSFTLMDVDEYYGYEGYIEYMSMHQDFNYGQVATTMEDVYGQQSMGLSVLWHANSFVVRGPIWALYFFRLRAAWAMLRSDFELDDDEDPQALNCPEQVEISWGSYTPGDQGLTPYMEFSMDEAFDAKICLKLYYIAGSGGNFFTKAWGVKNFCSPERWALATVILSAWACEEKMKEHVGVYTYWVARMSLAGPVFTHSMASDTMPSKHVTGGVQTCLDLMRDIYVGNTYGDGLHIEESSSIGFHCLITHHMFWPHRQLLLTLLKKGLMANEGKKFVQIPLNYFLEPGNVSPRVVKGALAEFKSLSIANSPLVPIRALDGMFCRMHALELLQERFEWVSYYPQRNCGRVINTMQHDNAALRHYDRLTWATDNMLYFGMQKLSEVVPADKLAEAWKKFRVWQTEAHLDQTNNVEEGIEFYQALVEVVESNGDTAFTDPGYWACDGNDGKADKGCGSWKKLAFTMTLPAVGWEGSAGMDVKKFIHEGMLARLGTILMTSIIRSVERAEYFFSDETAQGVPRAEALQQSGAQEEFEGFTCDSGGNCWALYENLVFVVRVVLSGALTVKGVDLKGVLSMLLKLSCIERCMKTAVGSLEYILDAPLNNAIEAVDSFVPMFAHWKETVVAGLSEDALKTLTDRTKSQLVLDPNRITNAKKVNYLKELTADLAENTKHYNLEEKYIQQSWIQESYHSSALNCQFHALNVLFSEENSVCRDVFGSCPAIQQASEEFNKLWKVDFEDDGTPRTDFDEYHDEQEDKCRLGMMGPDSPTFQWNTPELDGKSEDKAAKKKAMTDFLLQRFPNDNKAAAAH